MSTTVAISAMVLFSAAFSGLPNEAQEAPESIKAMEEMDPARIDESDKPRVDQNALAGRNWGDQ
jgi:hypothetical protein